VRSVRQRDGKVIDVLKLGERPPRISKKDRTMLINSTILAALTFLSTLAVNKNFTSLDLNQAVLLAVVPAATAFVTKIAEDRNILGRFKKSEEQ
jgi:hypothetical protein